ncbi:ABC transporter ATP-binding protein [Kurthia sibirica]|uniref:ABC transporter ATP-binding protein n=1 Tax=Kurthia sibirica TaxID=202750 RepID=A0A2U3APW3_9BACL|nr:ABC transporter ATP-binding protein [Kurthia sibirica]PWI26564.1 ABC transporter ATP-binding protein [Kurthia sibirica]GEK32814.1 putative ABC transporter ATP-binding protein YfiB [Kurthia sibirica]
MRRVLQYIAPYKWIALIGFLLMLVELTVELVQPLIIAKIIDEGILTGDVQTIWLWGGILLGLGVLAFIAGISNGFFAAHAAQSFGYDIRVALFKKVQALSMANFLKIPTSSLITRMTNDVIQVQNVFFMCLRFMLRAPLVVVGSLILAFFVNIQLALYLAMGIPFLILFLWLMTKKGANGFSLVQKSVDAVNKKIQENLQASRLVKAYMRGVYEATHFNKLVHRLKNDTMTALRLMERIQPVLLIVMNMSLLVVLWFGAKKVASSDLPVGDIVAIFNYAMRITGNFGMFAFLITFLSRASASANRMAEVLDMDNGEMTMKQTIAETTPYLAVNNISFHYPMTTEAVLTGITFSVERGQTIAIMGATGSGKTSLMQLLPRLYDVSSGSIVFDGREINSWPVEELRQKIGYVPQRSLLFTGSIYDNITWGKKDATMAEVIAACQAAQIHQSIERFPDGYQTRVGQKGVNLSGGQKQRIAIARAIIRQPDLLLFDDSMSALDIVTEKKLWQALQNYHATMLVVTQKVSTAQTAALILLVDKGQLIASGSHDELIKTAPLYAQIVASQQEVLANV